MFNKHRSGDAGKRSGTVSFFRRMTGTKNELPKASASTELTEVPQTAPSYKFVNQQKGEVDTRNEERGRTDEQIRLDSGKNPNDQEGPVTVLEKPTNKVEKNQKDNQASTSGELNLSDTFELYWLGETDYDLEEVVHSTANFWIPNAIAMFQILSDSRKFAQDNRFMVKHHPEYLDYAVACYYSILFYIQILRAQEGASRLEGFDKSFYRRFTDKFKLEELPVSCIMVPFFSTIVSSLSSDSKYGWIIPNYNTDIFTPGANLRAGYNPANRHGGELIQPMVPYMLMILRTAISTFRYENNQDRGAQFDASDRYIPRILTDAAAADVFGNDIQIGQEHARNAILYGCGIRYPFYANVDELERAAPKWRRSEFREFPYAMRIAGQAQADRTSRNQQLANTKDIHSLEYFLCMEKGADMSWFNELINQASLHARFFKSSTMLSKIPRTSGKEPMIVAHMYDMSPNAQGHLHTNADRTNILNLDQNANATAEHVTWYPHFMTDFRAGFATNREGVTREETLQAFSFATNATFSIAGAAGADRVGGNNEHFRTGRFWANQEWTSEFRNHRGQGAIAANEGDYTKPMFENWSIRYQERAAVVRPAGY